MPRIELDTTEIAGIPLVALAPEGARRLPIVFFVHGFNGDKSHGLELGYRLATRGFFFVSLDAPMHGARPDDRLAQAFDPGHLLYPAGTGLDAYFLMCQIAAQAAHDVGMLLAHYASDPRVDATRAGMSGVSMGAFATYIAAATVPGIACAVPMLGVPALARRWDDVVLEATAYREWTQALDDLAPETARRREAMRAIDPFERLPGFFPRPLLMIQGEVDVDAPKSYAVALFRLLRPVYASRPERLRLAIYDRTDHRVVTEMLADAAGWFTTYLGGD